MKTDQIVRAIQLIIGLVIVAAVMWSLIGSN